MRRLYIAYDTGRTMELLKLVYVCLLLSLKNVEVNCVCNLSLNKDYGRPFPVLLENGEYLTPSARNGHVVLQKGASLTVACPGKDRNVLLENITTNLDVLEAKCVQNTTFSAGPWRGHFQQISCDNQPWFTVEETEEKCYGGNNIARAGYIVRNTFHTLYEICFDRGEMSTLYVKHELTPASYYLQQGGARPPFTSGDFYDEFKIYNLYKKNYQKDRLNALLGNDMDKKYIDKNQFLTRGHLAARADFSLSFAQRASFHYSNAAPQWMRGNAGDWAALEEALRRRVKAYGSNVTVYTGTSGVLTLRDRDGWDREVYLYSDENNNNAVPVPLYFYKLVYDPVQKTAAAFVSINSPYYSDSELNQLVFCSEDCSERFPWLTWRANDGTTSFCCNYDEFIEKIKTLPQLDVRGLFT